MTREASFRTPGKLGRRALLALAMIGAGAVCAQAGPIDFSLNNGISVEQANVSALQTQALNAARMQGIGGTSTAIVQSGYGNYASTAIIGSGGSGTAALQIGDNNVATAYIKNSPGSAIAQFQLGNNNVSHLAIVNSANSRLANAQVGNGLRATYALQDSPGATMIVKPVDPKYNGGVTITGAPAGSIITVGG